MGPSTNSLYFSWYWFQLRYHAPFPQGTKVSQIGAADDLWLTTGDAERRQFPHYHSGPVVHNVSEIIGSTNGRSPNPRATVSGMEATGNTSLNDTPNSDPREIFEANNDMERRKKIFINPLAALRANEDSEHIEANNQGTANSDSGNTAATANDKGSKRKRKYVWRPGNKKDGKTLCASRWLKQTHVGGTGNAFKHYYENLANVKQRKTIPPERAEECPSCLPTEWNDRDVVLPTGP
ncbi:hypothetical protein BU15DRAFT_73895 [Melanogaster broomeanus]|nr:hypothetical protein BU15DRAFT_73895 [Melanogaster broomeanus]